ncbi:phage tail tape measure protein [Caloranaerobacter ferrireducens]|uniref:phage tail tape measure protein n=1 Tax=Caloranaerobacter ferrireducens TaxID=1323370 RepID=UPI00084DBEF1|nr:phage tail tape measure protein [Caloranaerobacter ferrireducens]
MALVVKIGANLRDFERKIKKATKDIRYVSNKLNDVGKSLTTKVTLPIMGVGVAAAKIGMDFDSAMSKVRAISGATGEEFEKLKEKAKEMGATTKFSASESAEAMKYMAMAGWDTTQILEGLDGVMMLAAASGEDLATVSDIVTDALTAFGMKASQANQFADLLAKTSSSANTNVSMLGESFKYVAPLFGSLGYSAEDAALALGLMANAGIKASQAGTTLRGAISRMLDPSKESAKLIEQLGLTFTDSAGNMLPFKDIMDQLREKFANLTEEQKAQYASTIFGKEAMSGMLAIINASQEDYQKLTEATRNYNGAAKEMSDIMQDNLQGQMTKLKSALEGAALSIYEVLKPSIEAIIAKIQEWTDWFNNLDKGTQEMIVKIGLLVAAIGPVLIIVGKAIALFGKLKAILTLLGATIGGLSAPVLITIGVIAGLIAIGVALYKNWDTVKAKILDVWNSIVTGIKGAINKIIGAINGMIRGMNRIKFSIPKWVPVIGGKSWGFNIPQIPMLEEGGIVTKPTLAMIGEGGEHEAVIPLSKLDRYNNRGNIIQVILDGKVIQEYVDNGLGGRVLTMAGV